MPKTPINLDNIPFHDRLTWFLGVGLGTGLSPVAPGTVGSLLILGLYPVWLSIGWVATIIAIVVMSLLGIYICGRSAEIMHTHDDPRIVWDEFAGQSITFLPILYLGQMNWLWVLIGFGLFRLFDIWKPWPIRIADQKVGGGFGIMLDDIIAGIWAALCIYLYFYFVFI